MHDNADRLDFAPPPQPAAVRAFVLAIIAHLLLLLALTWGINWNRDSDSVAAEAELWSSVPQQAAPKVVQAPPLPQPRPAPPPPPAPKVVEPPAPPVPAKQPDIALEREKEKREKEKRELAERRQEEIERQKQLEARKKQEELERQKKLEARKQQEEAEREKRAEARKKEEAEKRQQLAEQKAAEEKKKKAQELAEAKAKAKEEEARLADIRKDAMERMMKGAAGAPGDQGTAVRSSGPSSSYAGRIQARVRPHIVFSENVRGNPSAEVEVRMAPDGTITSRRLAKSSGIPSWDEAVLRALDKTEVLPRDVDGRIHNPLLIEFRPKG